MLKKSAQRKSYSEGFITIPVLVAIIVVSGLVIKVAYDRSHVLGTMIAQAPPQGGPPPPPQQEPPRQEAPKQEEKHDSPPQQPQQQPGQNQPNQPNQGGQPQYQPKNAEEKKQYQQLMQQYPEQQKQTYQKYQQQGEQQRTQQYQGAPNQGNFQQGSDPGGANARTGVNAGSTIPNNSSNGPQQQGNPGNQQGGSGSQGGSQGISNQGGANQQQFTPQQIEQFKQTEQQYRQEASKFGFQINGQLPNQFLKMQNSQGGPTTLPSVNDFPRIQGSFNIKAAGGKDLDLNREDTRIQFGSNFKAVRSDGSETEIDKASVEKINSAIKLVTGSEISKQGDKMALKRGDVSAATDLPLAFNVATKTFTVQTGNGEQQIKVLPDEALHKLFKNKVISDVQSGEGQAPNVKLTELNNKPVYEVKGAKQKKFLFFVPVSIPKTTYVSVENGENVSTQQSPVSKILESISF